MRIPFCGGTYTAYSESQNDQVCMNWYPEIVKDGENNDSYVLNPTPGLKSPISATGTPRGANVMAGVPYVVFGTVLYSVSSLGALTTIGTIAGSDRVSMSNDGTKLTITTGATAYQWDGTTLAAITDVDFVEVRHNSFLDGFTIYSGGNGQQFQISSPYDSDEIDALDFASAEANPDDIQTQEICNELIYFFGKKSVEIWQNVGATFPFAPISGAYIERGCIAEWSVDKLDGQLFWLADDLNVYRIQGYERFGITPPGIAEKIKTAANPENAYGFSYIDGGHAYYVLTFEEFTLVYDIVTQLWHERSSWSGLVHERWHVTHLYKAYGKEFALHEDGNIYEVDSDYYFEGTDIIVRDRITADVYRPDNVKGQRVFQSALEILFQEGMGLPDNTIPYAMLRYSDDGGFTWSNERWASIGKAGQYLNRTIWNRLGAFLKKRRYWVRVSAPVKACILDARGDFS